MRLAGRTAIVTGAGSGIGRASAMLFAKEGAFVALVDRDGAGLQETLAAIADTKGEASFHVGDVGEADFARTTVADVLARRGRLDVLMTAAGFSCGGTVLTTDPADWDAVFRTNVGGTWLWARAAVPEMQWQGGGSIITLASQLAIAGGKGNSAYIAAKGAIISLTRTMAVDFATDGIRVNAIAPGAIPGGGFAAPPAMAAKIPLGRFGTPADVAAVAVALLSERFGAYVTGATLAVDGGMALHNWIDP
jgi:2-keto-3-deoxy-L-fuconate dehydrogenase